MEPNKLSKVRDDETQTLITITLKEVHKTLQKLETMVTQQQQSMEETRQTLDDLTRKFGHFEASGPKTGISVNRNGFYKGWGLEHDFLTSHEYVARNDLLKILLKMKRLRVTGDVETIPELLTTIKTNGVGRYERFPSGGGGEYYVNINGDQIYTNISNIINFCNNRNLIGFDSQLTFLENRIHHPDYYTDRASFEKKYNLKWIQQ